MPTMTCAYPGCGVLVRRGRCTQHNVKRWYQRARWFRLRQQVLVAQAYQCAACGHVQQQLEVDHIVKHDDDPRRFYDRQNLQALCPACHVAKTNRGA
jgi:5-methylcytosine-specific restriction endonuclease McrA